MTPLKNKTFEEIPIEIDDYSFVGKVKIDPLFRKKENSTEKILANIVVLITIQVNNSVNVPNDKPFLIRLGLPLCQAKIKTRIATTTSDNKKFLIAQRTYNRNNMPFCLSKVLGK